MSRRPSSHEAASTSEEVTPPRKHTGSAADRRRQTQLEQVARHDPEAILGVVSYWLVPRRRVS